MGRERRAPLYATHFVANYNVGEIVVGGLRASPPSAAGRRGGIRPDRPLGPRRHQAPLLPANRRHQRQPRPRHGPCGAGRAASPGAAGCRRDLRRGVLQLPRLPRRRMASRKIGSSASPVLASCDHARTRTRRWMSLLLACSGVNCLTIQAGRRPNRDRCGLGAGRAWPGGASPGCAGDGKALLRSRATCPRCRTGERQPRGGGAHRPCLLQRATHARLRSLGGCVAQAAAPSAPRLRRRVPNSSPVRRWVWSQRAAARLSSPSAPATTSRPAAENCGRQPLAA